MAEIANKRAGIKRRRASKNFEAQTAQVSDRGFDPSSGRSPEWHWRKGLVEPPPRYPPIVARTSRAPVELSFGQKRLWFLSQLQSGSAAYNVPMAWRIKGKLNVSALQRALDEVVARHEALRTTFPADAGHPRQVVTEAKPVTVEEVDLRSVWLSARESGLELAVSEAAKRPFDLANGPVIRATVFRIEEEEHVFLLVLHHIVCDGPSIAILLQELAALYRSSVACATISLPTPPVQYADFAVWQRETLFQEVRDSQLAYWREQLRDCPVALDLPSDRSRSFRASFRGSTEYRELSPRLSEDFRSLVREHGVTRFMALLALFELLLSRYTGEKDVSVGCPMTHRTRAEVSRVIGFFANMMVLRLRLDGNPTFRELLQRTRDVALGAYAHQDFPFEQLVAELRPERMAGRNPFFQAMLVVEESAWRHLDLVDTSSVPFAVHNGTAKFDLSLYAFDHRQGFRLAMEYDADLFDRETASELLEHYENLLRGAVANPDCPVFNLPLLSSAERERVLVKWNDTRESDLQADCASRVFEAQVERTPDAIAVTFRDQSMAYGRLNSQANRLAHYLVSLGAGAEVLVAISLERSLDLVIAILAVMKSGAAYLPLDPSHPSARRDEILQDSGAKILITDQTVSTDMRAGGGCIVASLADGKLARQSDVNLRNAARPHDLAYVIYTSGSTGHPKGVEIEHGNLTNFLSAMRRCPGLSASDVLLAVTTVSFDIAGLELWLPLTTGASIILASREDAANAFRLTEIIKGSDVTVMQATPATWQMLLAAGWTGSPRLKVFCGGESLSGSLADDLLARCGSVWNMYGPTETTIWSCVHRAGKGEADVVPIGRPIGNTATYVLDRNGEPVPIGVRGELYIGGAGVARGYLGAPRLTAERFVLDPFCTRSGSRLYRTGDSVRQRRDGTLEFLGRVDRQIKIHGYRIEPAEIESVLRQHPAVQEAVVTMHDDSGNKRLAGYVVPAVPTEDFDGVELMNYLRRRLPDYMVPSGFALLDVLPISPNGKLNWKALPDPDYGVEEARFIAPRNTTEKRLAAIWQEILGLDRVGIKDNFFELGGHSILAALLFARIEKELGVRLPLGTLFEGPTIERLGAILRQNARAPGSLLQVQGGNSSTPPIFFVEARIGYHTLAAELGPDRPVYVIPYDDLLANDTELSLGEAAAELVQRIRSHQPCGPYYLGGWCLAGRVAFAMACELIRQKEEIALVAVIDMSAPGYPMSSRLPSIDSAISRLGYLLHGSRRQKLDWIAGVLRALSWQTRYRSWQLARSLFRQIGRPLPRPLRHTVRLMAEAVRKDATMSYPGRVTLFRPSERSFNRDDRWDLGWGEIARGGVDVHEITGLKHTLLRASVTDLGRRLKECLDDAETSVLVRERGAL